MSCITMVFPTASVSEWVWVPTFSSGWLAEDQRWLMASSSLIATPKMLDGLSGSTTKSTWKLSKSNKGQIVAVIWPCLILWWITSFGTIWVGRMLKVVLWMPFPFPQFTSQYIRGIHIAYKWIHDYLVLISRQYFNAGGNEGPNCKNLAALLQSYVQRSDLNLAREIAPNGKVLFGASRALKSPVLNMTGDHSPHVEATVAFNGRLQPNKTTWMKIQVHCEFLDFSWKIEWFHVF